MTVREEDCPRHEFYRDGKWQKCHRCDYWEPIGMVYIPESD